MITELNKVSTFYKRDDIAILTESHCDEKEFLEVKKLVEQFEKGKGRVVSVRVNTTILADVKFDHD